jgi:hypothetical protein
MKVDMNATRAFFINIRGQIVDTHGNIVENNTGSLPTEIIDNICKIADELYYITFNNTYQLHKVKFSGKENYVVDEFTAYFVRINGVIYNLIRDYSNMHITDIPSGVTPNDIHNVDGSYIHHRVLSGGVVYENHILMYVYIDADANLVMYNTQNSEHITIETNITCNKIFIVGNKRSVLHKLVLIYDNKIIQLCRRTFDRLFTFTHNEITQTPFTINKIYFSNDDKTLWKIIDSDANVYDARVDISTPNADIIITPLQFNYSISDIIYDVNIKKPMYLSTERLLYNSKGVLLMNEILTRKITVTTKSANFICNT